MFVLVLSTTRLSLVVVERLLLIIAMWAYLKGVSFIFDVLAYRVHKSGTVKRQSSSVGHNPSGAFKD